MALKPKQAPRHGAILPAHDARRVLALADCDRRTLTKVLRGRTVRGGVDRRIRAALLQIGRPDLAGDAA